MSKNFLPFVIEVPATSANLGPGFDSFGLALALYNRFSVAPADTCRVTIHGYSDQELERPESNLVFAIYRQLCRANNWRPVTFALTNENAIPLYGGIGSSASAIVAGIAIAKHIHQADWNKEHMLRIAFGFESHLDNIAAAIFGGFVATSFYPQGREQPLVLQKIIEKPLCAWLLVPHLRVATSASRISMPQQVSYSDAVFNLAHAAQLALAFERQDWQLLGDCMQDRLHQPYRQEASAGLLSLSKEMYQAGAYGMAISGSGPAVIVFCDAPNPAMRTLVEQHMQTKGLTYTCLELTVDNKGVCYS